MVRQPRVRGAQDEIGLRARREQEHGLHALSRAAPDRRPDHRGIQNPRLIVQRALDIFRKDVESLRRHDHFLLASADEQTPVRVELTDIARVEPAVLERLARRLRRLVVAGRHVVSAHQDFAIAGDLDLDAGDRLADRATLCVEWMVQRHDRGGLRQPVSLDHEEPEAAPERFQLRVERRRPHHHRPELEPEHLVDPAVMPPPPGPVHPGRRRIRRLRRHADDVVAQHLEDLRHAHEHRDPPFTDLPDDVVGGVAAGEDDQAGQHGRHEGGHGLAEHVTERQEVQEADRAERARVLLVLRHLALDRDDVREDVLVGEDDPLRFRRRAGREDDLGGGGSVDDRGPRIEDCGGGNRSVRLHAEDLRKAPDSPSGPERGGIHRLAHEDGFRVDDPRHLEEKIRRRPVVDRDDDDPFEQRPPHRGDPFRAVFAPDRDRLAGCDAFVTQALREAARRGRDIPVRPGPRAIPVVVGEKLRVLRGGVRSDIREEVEQRMSRHVS